MASCYGYIYIFKYIYNTSSYATIITHFIRRYMYNTSSYVTIVTLNLYVNTLFLQNGGVQEALVNQAFLSLFIIFRTLKRPQSLGLRIVYPSPMMWPSSSSKFGGAVAPRLFKLKLLVRQWRIVYLTIF